MELKLVYKYVDNISKLAQNIIAENISRFNTAIDATLGNGYDTDFLSEAFKQVYAFDIQSEATEKYKLKNKDNVVLINSSHDNIMDFVKEGVDCVVYNLGYLPGGNKNITTIASTTISSIKQSLNLLNPGGIISIAIYPGHEEGMREKDVVLNYASMLPKEEYGVLVHYIANRNNSPLLVIIEKNIK
jgi:16S rRNA C1402 N4-methylase RsmH